MFKYFKFNYLCITICAVLYGVSFICPAYLESPLDLFGEGDKRVFFYGYECFIVAIEMLSRHENLGEFALALGLNLCNFLFIINIVIILFFRSKLRLIIHSQILAIISAISWFFMYGGPETPSDFLVGYWLWYVSIFLLYPVGLYFEKLSNMGQTETTA